MARQPKAYTDWLNRFPTAEELAKAPCPPLPLYRWQNNSKDPHWTRLPHKGFRWSPLEKPEQLLKEDCQDMFMQTERLVGEIAMQLNCATRKRITEILTEEEE